MLNTTTNVIQASCVCKTGFAAPICSECAAGYTQTSATVYNTTGQFCSLCNAGFYKNVTGSLPCLRCGTNTYSSTVGSTSCTPCPNNTGTNGPSNYNSINSCVPVAGYQRNGSTNYIAVPCPANTFKTSIGIQSCDACATSCTTGKRIGAACNSTQNILCVPCSACAQGLTKAGGCTGNETDTLCTGEPDKKKTPLFNNNQLKLKLVHSPSLLTHIYPYTKQSSSRPNTTANIPDWRQHDHHLHGQFH